MDCPLQAPTRKAKSLMPSIVSAFRAAPQQWGAVRLWGGGCQVARAPAWRFRAQAQRRWNITALYARPKTGQGLAPEGSGFLGGQQRIRGNAWRRGQGAPLAAPGGLSSHLVFAGYREGGT